MLDEKRQGKGVYQQATLTTKLNATLLWETGSKR